MAQIEEMRRQLADVAEFAFVYIKEAHPDDEWQMESNVETGVVFSQPQTFEERQVLGRAFVEGMNVETRTLVDDIGNTANACFAAWPERIYIIGTDGRIEYKGGMGPFYFKPDEILRHFQER